MAEQDGRTRGGRTGQRRHDAPSRNGSHKLWDKLPEHEGGRGIPERGPGRGQDRETGRRPGGEVPEHEGGKGVPERGTSDRGGKGSGRGTDPGREIGGRDRQGRRNR